MIKHFPLLLVLTFLIFGSGVQAQDEAAPIEPADINGTWVTQSGNLVEVEVNGNSVRLTFPDFALTRDARIIGSTLVYITHYNDVSQEEIYLNVPESERAACERFVHNGDERHRFTLSLSDDGMVLSGIKEINVMICEYDTDENGNTSNHRAVGFQWTYFSDYQWRRTNCDFSNLPPTDGNVLEKYELIDTMLDRFGLIAEFKLGDFSARDRIKFIYEQAYIDSDTGEFVPFAEKGNHQHVEPLDGRVTYNDEISDYVINLYPYAFQSHITLLTGLTILCHQIKSLNETDEILDGPTTQMEKDSIDYVWAHRHTLCSNEDDNFDHHIDFLSRALRFRQLEEEKTG